MLDKTKAREIATNYSLAVKNILNPDKVLMFGSYVNGIPHKDSDIDVAVFVRGLDNEAWYDTRILLQRIRRNRDFVDIEPHLLDETDDPSGFAEHVIKTGEILFSRS